MRDDRVASCVSEAAEPNSQYRPYMEDRWISVDPFMPGETGSEQWGFFAVYDGHGGSQAAESCEAEFHRLLMAELRTALREQRRPSSPLTDDTIAAIFARVFQKMDDQLRGKGAWRFGCTATIVLVRRSASGVRLHTANVGDSRAVAVDGGRGEVRVSMDHRPTDPSEARRVREEGGFVSMGRVGGELAVSRAMGDLLLKSSGVSCRPSVSARDASRDLAVVIASDGLWDTIEDKEVAKLVGEQGRHGREQMASKLVQEAQRRGSMDNICCIAAFL